MRGKNGLIQEGKMGTKDHDKNWKKVLIKCLEELRATGIINEDVGILTGRLVLDININQGGITDLDVSVKRKYK